MSKQARTAAPALQKPAAHTQCPAEKVPQNVQNILQSPGVQLDKRTQNTLGPKCGFDFGKVKIHTGSAAVQSARSVNAAAFTVGKSIVFGEGKAADRSLVEHELGHIKEQWLSSEPVLQCRKDPSTILQDSEVAAMLVQIEEIRSWIASGSLNKDQKRVILSHISRWYEKDRSLNGITPYLDKFLFFLQTKTATEHHGIGETFGYNEQRLLSDALWHDLDGELLQQYKDLVAHSKSQKTTGPEFARGDGALKTIARQEAIGMTAAVKGLSTGLAGVAGRASAESVGENFDDLGELMFGKEWSNGESLFLGLSAKDIGEFGGGVIWDLVMMGKGGAVNTIDKVQMGMAKVNAVQNIALSVRDIYSIITRLNETGPLTAQRVLGDPDFQKTTLSLAGEVYTALSKDPLKSEKVRLILSSAETVVLGRKLVIAYREMHDNKDAAKQDTLEKAFGQAILENIKQVVGLLRSSHQLAKHTQEAAAQKKSTEQTSQPGSGAPAQSPAKKQTPEVSVDDSRPQKQQRKTAAGRDEPEELSAKKIPGLVTPSRPKATLIKANLDTFEAAQHHYEEQLRLHNGKFEAAIFQDRKTGKYMVSLGNEVEVNSVGPGDFRPIKHFHPNEFNAKQFRLPASADFATVHEEYMRNGNRRVSEVVESPVPGKGLSRVEFGVDPTLDKNAPYFFTVTMPGEKPTTTRFRTLKDLDTHKSDMDTTYVDPTKPLYWQMMGGGAGDGDEGKTMAGGAKTTSLPKPVSSSGVTEVEQSKPMQKNKTSDQQKTAPPLADTSATSAPAPKPKRKKQKQVDPKLFATPELAENVNKNGLPLKNVKDDPQMLLTMAEELDYVQYDPKINKEAGHRVPQGSRFSPGANKSYKFGTRTYQFDGLKRIIRASTTRLTIGIRDEVMSAEFVRPENNDYGHLLGVQFGTIDAQLGMHGGIPQASNVNRPLGKKPALWYNAERIAFKKAIALHKAGTPYEVIAEARYPQNGVPETQIRVIGGEENYESGWIASQ